MGAIETPKFLKDTAGILPSKVQSKFILSLPGH